MKKKTVQTKRTINGHDGTEIELFLLPPDNYAENQILFTAQGTSYNVNLCLEIEQAENLLIVLNQLVNEAKSV
ncbi:hypothetical protein [Prevotella sp. 10(H)]|uniref:hypothetical protein n=1 Tax=Prevotella sp. 10(H) TaxID=1158294 RepID=UPI0004A7870A|nr:hypothetical protein [Prevotella sp. 10(H)]